MITNSGNIFPGSEILDVSVSASNSALVTITFSVCEGSCRRTCFMHLDKAAFYQLLTKMLIVDKVLEHWYEH